MTRSRTTRALLGVAKSAASQFPNQGTTCLKLLALLLCPHEASDQRPRHGKTHRWLSPPRTKHCSAHVASLKPSLSRGHFRGLPARITKPSGTTGRIFLESRITRNEGRTVNTRIQLGQQMAQSGQLGAVPAVPSTAAPPPARHPLHRGGPHLRTGPSRRWPPPATRCSGRPPSRMLPPARQLPPPSTRTPTALLGGPPPACQPRFSSHSSCRNASCLPPRLCLTSARFHCLLGISMTHCHFMLQKIKAPTAQKEYVRK